MKFDIVDPKEQAKKKKAQKKKNDQRFYIALGLLLVVLILLMLYYSSIENNSVKSTPVGPRVIQESKLKIVNENSNERPLAVMIDNNVGSSSQAGLQDSYINYEIIVEGGLTRIMAIYKDKEVGLIGPVRSSRHYFLDYAMEHDAVYAHYGWSPQAEKDIKNLNINNINGMVDSGVFVRDKNSAAPHNVFTSSSRLRNYFSNKDYDEETSNWRVLNYSYTDVNFSTGEQDESLEVQENNASKADKVSMSYSNNQIRSYTYDDTNEYYLRFMNNSPHLDKNSRQQLHFKNIIIMKVNNRLLDNEGRQTLDTTGEGEGYYITNGYSIPIKWSKDSRSSKTIYSYENGEELSVNDGNTFIQIVPMNSNITIE